MEDEMSVSYSSHVEVMLKKMLRKLEGIEFRWKKIEKINRFM